MKNSGIDYYETIDPAADYFDIVAKLNRANWRILNTFQIGYMWRVNVQKQSESGATLQIFTEFAEHPSVHQAAASCWERAQAIDALDKKRKGNHPTIPSAANGPFSPKTEAKLVRSMDALFFAVKMDGRTRSNDRADDL